MARLTTCVHRRNSKIPAGGRTNQLQDCPRQELINAYDNTIVYSDYVLSQVIKLLQQNNQRFDTAMLYI